MSDYSEFDYGRRLGEEEPDEPVLSEEELAELEVQCAALDAAYAESDALQAAWLASNPDVDPDEAPDYEQEARERRP